MGQASRDFLDRLGIEHPIVQAPMAGVASPALAAAVSNAGGLGSVGVGATDAAGARGMIAGIRERTNRGFNVNVFCHAPAVRDAARESAWLDRMKPVFAEFDAAPPSGLTEIYRSFREDDAMLALFVETRPKVVSFHFGLPSEARIRALREAGILLFASATNLAEAEQIQAAGLDAVVAQGWEAGGHRGLFDPAADDPRLGTMALTRLLSTRLTIPVIAAGGLMDGAGIAAALRLGAAAAQLGTAFIGADESLADAAYRSALASEAAQNTVMTPAISGRPARCLANRFTAWAADAADAEVPAYPVTYDAGKALHAAARQRGEAGFGAYWAGQGAPLAQPAPATEIMARLVRELAEG